MHRRSHLRTAPVPVAGVTHGRLLALAALSVLGVLVCTGCSHAVKAKVPVGGDSPVCAQVAAQLPGRLLKQKHRDTDPNSPSLAAWGDPAIILRCGVATPGPSTDHCETVNGVDWVVQPLSDGASFTTYGRTPAIQVLVPKHYAPEEFALTGLSTAVDVVPQGEHRCR